MQVAAGMRFSRLVTIKLDTPKNGRKKWVCRCDCGNETSVEDYALKSGNTRSCGCLQKEIAARIGKNSATHGHTVAHNLSPTYLAWTSMRARCNYKSVHGYEYYGGRGVKVCDRWNNFANFIEDMGERPDGASIDRIDVNGNYSPENCRWATVSEQANNKRNSNFITFKGLTLTGSQWSAKLGLHRTTVNKRIGKGWPVEEALKEYTKE